jgi:hypothetical protein
VDQTCRRCVVTDDDRKGLDVLGRYGKEFNNQKENP